MTDYPEPGASREMQMLLRMHAKFAHICYNRWKCNIYNLEKR